MYGFDPVVHFGLLEDVTDGGGSVHGELRIGPPLRDQTHPRRKHTCQDDYVYVVSNDHSLNALAT